MQFQSTHSLRSATAVEEAVAALLKVSIHALLAECDTARYSLYQERRVSIHALLAECDSVLTAPLNSTKCFNPRTPCGVRPYRSFALSDPEMFQSTHSLRSATFPAGLGELHPRCFNPRTPCGVRHFATSKRPVSIRFQSTHSLRSATLLIGGHVLIIDVSIHALLAECDCWSEAAAMR